MDYLNKSIELIEEYLSDEFGDDYDISADDLNEVGLMYTTDGDNEEVELQVYVDLLHPSIKYCVRGYNSADYEVRHEDKYNSLKDLIDRELVRLDWDDLYSRCIDFTVPEDYM